LFSKEKFMKTKKKDYIDLSTTIMPKLKVISKVSNETRFNVDEFSTWRSAFREAVKLRINIVMNSIGSEESKLRLEKWSTLGADREYGQFSMDACQQAVKFVDENYKPSYKKLTKINDRLWLEQEFDKHYPSVRKKIIG
jgi:transposase